jgi:hypothetical protein
MVYRDGRGSLRVYNQVWLENYGKSSTAFKQDVYQAAAGKLNRVTTGGIVYDWRSVRISGQIIRRSGSTLLH